jgi:hypothetical protein
MNQIITVIRLVYIIFQIGVNLIKIKIIIKHILVIALTIIVINHNVIFGTNI